MSKKSLSILILGVLAGCGPGSPSDPAPTVTTPPPVPTLVSISIGSDLALQVGDFAPIIALGAYSDGGSAAVSCDWSLSLAGIVTLDHAQGTSVTASAAAAGSVDLTATKGAISATITLTVSAPPPVLAGPIYGDVNGGLMSYPLDGSAPVAASAVYRCAGLGAVVSRDGSRIYFVGDYQGYYVLVSANAADPSDATVVATFNGNPAPYITNPMGIDIDGQGRVILYGYDGGCVARYDPATGATTVYITVGATIDIAADSAGNVYWGPFLGTVGQPIISKYTYFPEYGFGFPGTWAMAPADIAESYFVISGISFNGRDEAFVMASYGTKVYRFLDANGDGEAEEAETFATLPGTYGDTEVCGVSGAGDDGVLINRKMGPAQTADNTGIFWLVDRNNNGNADDEGETVLFNSTYLQNGNDAGCITAPR